MKKLRILLACSLLLTAASVSGKEAPSQSLHEPSKDFCKEKEALPFADHTAIELKVKAITSLHVTIQPSSSGITHPDAGRAVVVTAPMDAENARSLVYDFKLWPIQINRRNHYFLYSIYKLPATTHKLMRNAKAKVVPFKRHDPASI